MMMIRGSSELLLLLVMLAAAPSTMPAQGSAGTDAQYEPRMIVDMPTAGVLPKGSFALDLSFYHEGGVLAGLSTGIFDRLTVGVSYGGARLIGPEAPVMDPLPGLQVKVRILNESVVFPALLLGFDSQGRDGYQKGQDRYALKSPGLFAVVSKNYTLLGFLSAHGGVNYSLERGPEERSLNAYLGAEKTLGPFLSLLVEYNAALNESDERAFGKSGRGYLGMAVHCSLGAGFTLGVNFKDLLRNARDMEFANRTVHLEYITFF